MAQNQIDLAALIGSRICHDLISPIGAINNGLELLNMSGVETTPEMSLINESVSSASARIRYFRIAFGAAGDQMIGPGEVNSILRDVYGSSRLDITWQPDEPTSRSVVRLLFLSIMCLETAMPYGGRISVGSEDTKWTLSGTADKLNVNADLWGLLAGQTPLQTPQPAHVQFAMLPLIAREERRRVHSNLGETDIEIAFEAA